MATNGRECPLASTKVASMLNTSVECGIWVGFQLLHYCGGKCVIIRVRAHPHWRCAEKPSLSPCAAAVLVISRSGESCKTESHLGAIGSG